MVTWQKMKRSSGVPQQSPCEEPGLHLCWPACPGHNSLCISSHLVNNLWKIDTHIAALGLHHSQQDWRKACERSRCESFMVFIQMPADCARATTSPWWPFTLRQQTPSPVWPSSDLAARGFHGCTVGALFRYCSAGVCWHIPWDQYLFLHSRLHRERERERMKLQIKLLFAFWFFAVSPFPDRKPSSLSFTDQMSQKFRAPRTGVNLLDFFVWLHCRGKGHNQRKGTETLWSSCWWDIPPPLQRPGEWLKLRLSFQPTVYSGFGRLLLISESVQRQVHKGFWNMCVHVFGGLHVLTYT